MPEVTSSTAASAAMAGGAITLTGSVFGLGFDVLLVGFVGGLMALSYLPPMNGWQRVASVSGAAVVAGYLAPLLAFALKSQSFVPEIITVDMLRLPAALGLGYVAQGILLPRLRELVARKVDEVGK